MKMFVRSVRHFRSACQHGRTNFSNGLKNIPNRLITTSPKSFNYTGGLHVQQNPSCIITRLLCTEVSNVSTTGRPSSQGLFISLLSLIQFAGIMISYNYHRITFRRASGGV